MIILIHSDTMKARPFAVMEATLGKKGEEIQRIDTLARPDATVFRQEDSEVIIE